MSVNTKRSQRKLHTAKEVYITLTEISTDLLPTAVKKTTPSSPLIPKVPCSTLLRKKELVCSTRDKSKASASRLKNAKLPPPAPRNNCSPVPKRKFMMHDLCSPINSAEITKAGMLTIGIEKEDSRCNPYELENTNLLYSRKVEVKKKLKSTLNLIRRIDLKKGSFSSKQIMSAGNSLNNSRSSSSKAKALYLENTFTEEGSGSFIQSSSTRTPSPSMNTSRNSKLSLLSRKFKIDKPSFVQNIQNQTRRSQSTNLNSPESLSETLPFQHFLKDLEFISNVTETRPLPSELQRRNLSLKLKCL